MKPDQGAKTRKAGLKEMEGWSEKEGGIGEYRMGRDKKYCTKYEEVEIQGQINLQSNTGKYNDVELSKYVKKLKKILKLTKT